MDFKKLKKQIAKGEDKHQFKANVHNPDSLAGEMTAFANSNGGTIFIGVSDDGSMPGLSQKKEELRRLFQSVDLLHGDETPTKAGIDKLDRLRFRDFLKEIYEIDLPEKPDALLKLLQNMNLACENGFLNLAGVLLFSEKPEWIKPAFIVKAVSYPGKAISISEYLDSEDFCGPMKKIFDDTLAFIMRNLKKVQAGQNINTLGVPEIPKIVFEELIVNALIHRDYFISSVIRIFIFEDKIEIISPGHLPNNLTIEKILAGNSNIRNPILASFVAKNLLPYRGLGSGIRRSLEEWPDINFVDDREGCTFKVIIHKNIGQEDPLKKAEQSKNKDLKVHLSTKNEPLNELQNLILNFIRTNPNASYEDLTGALNKGRSTIMRNINKLKDAGWLSRIGSKKKGHWKITT